VQRCPYNNWDRRSSIGGMPNCRGGIPGFAAFKKRTQRKTRLGGVTAWTKRSKTSGEFMAVKKPAAKKKAAKKFKDVRRER
jgi:hypothetical protein